MSDSFLARLEAPCVAYEVIPCDPALAETAAFASAEQTRELTGMSIGSVTPVGLPSELATWVDARVMERERIILGGGGRERKVLAAPGHPDRARP